MKNAVKTFSYIFGLSIILVSCSVARNSITRGDQSSYGIGSGVSASHKSTSKSNKAVEEVEQNASISTNASELDPATPYLAVENIKSSDNVIEEKKSSVQVLQGSNLANIKLTKKIKNAINLNKIAYSPEETTDKKGESKSWYLAIGLCFFFGLLGMHRFYLGYTWQGWVQLFTLGGLGVWWLIDLVRIITRKLEPRCGIYEDI